MIDELVVIKGISRHAEAMRQWGRLGIRNSRRRESWNRSGNRPELYIRWDVFCKGDSGVYAIYDENGYTRHRIRHEVISAPISCPVCGNYNQFKFRVRHNDFKCDRCGDTSSIENFIPNCDIRYTSR